MTRSALASALVLAFSAATASGAFAQAAQSASPSSTPASAPPARAKWIAPVKGLATVEVIRGNPKQVGNEMQTVVKVRNVSTGAIALLRADEYWYDTSRKMVTGDTQRVTKLINPGEIVEITMKSPMKPNLQTSQIQFAHANGKIEVKNVKAFK
jgi:hypothetical protein